MPTQGPLRFYFDLISPYAYLGWRQLYPFAEGQGMEVEPIPVLFAAMLNAHGHKGPAEIPPKRLYTWKHVVRLASELQVDLQPPPAHPFNPLLGLRVATLPHDAATQRRIIDKLFSMTWGGGPGVTDPVAVAAGLDDIGLDGAELVRRSAEPTAKAAVKAATEQAIAAGVFGVPSFGVGEEIFWGQDSLAHVKAHLEGRDPVTAEDLARWADLPIGVARTPR